VVPEEMEGYVEGEYEDPESWSGVRYGWVDRRKRE